jgi:hypothetical protein
MLCCVGGLYLVDPIPECLIVRTRRGELAIDFEGELAVSLLQVKLRHRLVDEWLRAGAAESAIVGCRADRLGLGRGRLRPLGLWRWWCMVFCSGRLGLGLGLGSDLGLILDNCCLGFAGGCLRDGLLRRWPP